METILQNIRILSCKTEERNMSGSDLNVNLNFILFFFFNCKQLFHK